MQLKSSKGTRTHKFLLIITWEESSLIDQHSPRSNEKHKIHQWLQSAELKAETEACIMAAQE